MINRAAEKGRRGWTEWETFLVISMASVSGLITLGNLTCP